jgi:hypothetical protein
LGAGSCAVLMAGKDQALSLMQHGWGACPQWLTGL